MVFSLSMFRQVVSYIAVIAVLSALIGSSSALFLWVLDAVTHFRTDHLYIILLLPLAGASIAWMYQRFGEDVDAGNAVFKATFKGKKKNVPWVMYPLVLVGTWLTHLFGGSAGREGTALQMGAAVASQWPRLDKWWSSHQDLLVIIGVSAGFASVFGTPLAGAVFALEYLHRKGGHHPLFVLTAFGAAFGADFICDRWGILHSAYDVQSFDTIQVSTLALLVIIGSISCVVGSIYTKIGTAFSEMFSYFFKNKIIRAFGGGVVLVVVIVLLDTDRHIGLGVPYIQSAFLESSAPLDWLIKLLLTAFTLSAGFRGGEVTPLFYIGATMASALGYFFPNELSILVAGGFVGVFAFVTKTPIASFLMALELFGISHGLAAGISLLVVSIWSAKTSVS